MVGVWMGEWLVGGGGGGFEPACKRLVLQAQSAHKGDTRILPAGRHFIGYRWLHGGGKAPEGLPERALGAAPERVEGGPHVQVHGRRHVGVRRRVVKVNHVPEVRGGAGRDIEGTCRVIRGRHALVWHAHDWRAGPNRCDRRPCLNTTPTAHQQPSSCAATSLACPAVRSPVPASTPPSPDLLAAAVHHPVVPVKGQLVSQQVEQPSLGRVLLRPAPAGPMNRTAGDSRNGCASRLCPQVWQSAAHQLSGSLALHSARMHGDTQHARGPPKTSTLVPHLNLSRRGPPQAAAPPCASSHRSISRHARSFTAARAGAQQPAGQPHGRCNAPKAQHSSTCGPHKATGESSPLHRSDGTALQHMWPAKSNSGVEPTGAVTVAPALRRTRIVDGHHCGHVVLAGLPALALHRVVEHLLRGVHPRLQWPARQGR